jgi:N-acetylmuramidase-like protein/putative peptidoglycan binding protein
MEFARDGVPLSEGGVSAAAEKLGVGAAALWAVVSVETRGCGFLPDRRPQILFERHVFHKETGGAFDAIAPDLSNPTPGGYGAAGIPQYDRLTAAMALNPQAALRSASWGIGQVMGFHAEALGYPDVEGMVASMVDSEDEQMRAVVAFIVNAGLHRAMQRGDWTAFARGYNGADFATNRYDERLRGEYASLLARGLPDLRVRTAQVYLMYRGLEPGPVDGVLGDRTRGALSRFQAQVGLPVTGAVNDETLTRLTASV